MQIRAGNRAIAEHSEQGKGLLLAPLENAFNYSGPAYLPAVSGNSDFTIFIFETSTVPSM